MSSPNALTLPGFGGTSVRGRLRMSISRQASSEPGAAERGEREVADVEALGDGDLAQRVGLVPRGDLQDAGGGPLQREVELRAELRPSPSIARLDRQRDLAAQQVRGDPAEDDVRVGDGGLVAAVRVAHRARVGAGRLRADLERALGGEPGDRAAAGADGDDVDHRDLATGSRRPSPRW